MIVGYPYISNDNNIELDRSLKEKSALSFAYFGQFTPYKGIDVFIEACMIVHRQFKDINFYVYGNSQQAMGSEFTENIRDLKLKSTNVVSFMGGYDNSNSVELMKTVDVVVIPIFVTCK
jgi:glycosyltransferase involved in cell wall biosynthesis